jgi:NAD(P)-dependent dehydrogenase (short-subunit alcohol dehydrogenase family)
MKDFAGRIAVITGGGTGMGRELARQLAAEGCNVAICDVSTRTMAETVRLCEAERPSQGTRITAHRADVAVEAELIRFRDEVAGEHNTDKVHLLFNNAGIGGGGSVIANTRAAWERTFNVCWAGVYLGVRTFLPMLLKADQGHIVNTSSFNGFWAVFPPGIPHTAYAAAKFAVKGFTEALITDLRVNAPHVKCSVVMPGHVGTSIMSNTLQIHAGGEDASLTPPQLARVRVRLAAAGVDTANLSDDEVRALMAERARRFKDEAPTTAAEAARIILEGVKTEQWRILVGKDALAIDRMVREAPEEAYEPEFFRRLAGETGWRLS